VKPVCKRLRVRKDIKCLTELELSELIDAFQELYRRGIMDRFSLIHAAYWPATHKFAEGITWHRWHVNQIERELRKINPRVTMPYWVICILFIVKLFYKILFLYI
jgi:tyrosinase